ncbi:hypothetical protein GG344DRAFT_18009, partial [Lentinula edodes]
LTEFVTLKVSSTDGSFTSRNVPFIVAPGLCTQLLLGLPWLTHNQIVIDYALRTCIHKPSSIDLLHPPPVHHTFSFKSKSIENVHSTLRKSGNQAKEARKDFLAELKDVCSTIRPKFPPSSISPTVTVENVIAAVRSRIESLATLTTLQEHESRLKKKYFSIFEPIPHVD